MLNVGIVGAAGYTAGELLKILIKHPKVNITSLSRKSEKTCKISDIFPFLVKTKITDKFCNKIDKNKIADEAELFFLTLPHTVSMEVAPVLLKAGKKVIDLSADYRLKDAAIYNDAYAKSHTDEKNLLKSVYGLPELYKQEIKNAQLIANPGCYPTGIILGVTPLLKNKIAEIDSIISDSKSGLTGAGKTLSPDLLFSEVNENCKSYKVNQHQHIPEINQELSKQAGKKIEIVFVPHLVPMNRGILNTMYIKLNKDISLTQILGLYKDFYKDSPFMRILDENIMPEVKYVRGTNFCDIGIKIFKEQKLAIVISAIDNLVKGASGQAVQNMNIVCGFNEILSLV